MSEAGTSESSGLREYALLLWGRKFLVLLIFLVATGGALAYCAAVTPKYTATSELLLTPTLSPTLLEANGGLTQNQAVDVPSDSEVIESNVVKDLVDKDVPDAPSATVTEVGTTDVVKIVVSDSKADVAAKAASDYASQYIKYEQQQTQATLDAGINLVQKHINTLHLAISELQNKISATTNTLTASGLQTQLTTLNQENADLENELANYEDFSGGGGAAGESGQVISYASVPSSPSSPKTVEYTVLAAIIGLVLGIGVAMLVEALTE